MRLLNTFTGRFELHDDPTKVRYAILSHTWSKDGEQSYQDVLALQEAAQAREAITRGACKIARQHGYRFIWIDACCIDKTSSAELSEAINSMFLWYTLADVCFVYMADVPHSLDGPQTGWESAFRESRWHTRGWTLQELIAPEYMLFLDSEWSVIGSKMELASTLAEITGVDEAVLVHAVPVNRISVLDRMRWASERETTRVEDEAYCLMGLFGIHMPTIYGEGRKAFIRLQQEIIKTIPDQSVFLW
ncbi:HET-domain-containing protein, partial [Pilatotrama ljubarskyi]